MSISIKKCFTYFPLDPEFVGQGSESYRVANTKALTTHYWYNKEDAIANAESYASSHPKVPVLVLQSILVVEAKRPETQQKEFKDNGELLPAKSKE